MDEVAGAAFSEVVGTGLGDAFGVSAVPETFNEDNAGRGVLDCSLLSVGRGVLDCSLLSVGRRGAMDEVFLLIRGEEVERMPVLGREGSEDVVLALTVGPNGSSSGGVGRFAIEFPFCGGVGRFALEFPFCGVSTGGGSWTMSAGSSKRT